MQKQDDAGQCTEPESNREFAMRISAECAHAYADVLERLAREAVTAWEEKQAPHSAGNTIRKEMGALRDFLAEDEEMTTS